MITVPPKKIVDENGNMTPSFLTWINQVINFDPILGTGSPEGVIKAEQGRWYADTSAGTGSMIYFKRDGDIGKDPTQGWILV